MARTDHSDRQAPEQRLRAAEAARVVLLSVGLALLLEMLQVALAAATGTEYGPSKAARDTILKVPWAIVVCLALWFAIRTGGGRPLTVAVVGLVAAPIASLLARSSAEMARALAAAAEPAAAPSPLVVAATKGVEYACLALLLLWLGRRTWSTALHHAGAGLVTGLVFGGVLLGLTALVSADAFSAGGLGAFAVNELLFPVGCALIVFANTRPR
jgi:hypothetical protein